MALTRFNVGKIAERIVMNELDARGYRTTDLNKDGVSANADLLTSKDGKVWQLQVKGAVNKKAERWWVQYGYCTTEIINKESKIFNRRNSFYTAQYVVLVAVKSPSDYRCFVLPVKRAEEAAQLNLDGYYRQPRASDGGVRKPGKMWLRVERSQRERRNDPQLSRERRIVAESENAWELT